MTTVKEWLEYSERAAKRIDNPKAIILKNEIKRITVDFYYIHGMGLFGLFFFALTDNLWIGFLSLSFVLMGFIPVNSVKKISEALELIEE